MEPEMLTFVVENKRPVDLQDLASSMSAFAREFTEYASDRGAPAADQFRLGVREIRSGSIIADLVPMSEQLTWVVDHAEIIGGFVTHVKEIIEFLLYLKGKAPSKKQAERVAQIVEPVAKDAGAVTNIIAQTGAVVFNNCTINSVDANAIQNAARRFVGPAMPAEAIEKGVILTLAQVKNDPSSKTGDKGVIEKISHRPAKLHFLTSDAKAAIIDMEGRNPFRCAFLVDAKVHFIDGIPKLYEIHAVRDVIPLDDGDHSQIAVSA